MSKNELKLNITDGVLSNAFRHILSHLDEKKVRFVLREFVIAWDARLPLDQRVEAIRRLNIFIDYLKTILVPDKRKVKELIPYTLQFEIFQYYKKIDEKILSLKRLAYSKRIASLKQMLTEEQLPLSSKQFDLVINSISADRRTSVTIIVGKKYIKSPAVIRKLVSNMEVSKSGLIKLKKPKLKT